LIHLCIKLLRAVRALDADKTVKDRMCIKWIIGIGHGAKRSSAIRSGQTTNCTSEYVISIVNLGGDACCIGNGLQGSFVGASKGNVRAVGTGDVCYHTGNGVIILEGEGDTISGCDVGQIE